MDSALSSPSLNADSQVEKYVVCVDTFKVVLRLCKVGGLADEALMVLKKMPEFNIRPDTTAYNLVIRSLCEKGDMDMAKQLMGEMGLIDLYPDMITYVSMIKGFGIVEKAFELLAEMEKEGEGCRPNVITYTSVIQSFCEQGRAKDALSVLELMEIKKVEEAEKTFRMALSSGMKPDSLACSMMIREICSEKRVLDGFCLYEEVEKTGCLSSIDIDIYSILLAGLCQKSHSAEAARLARSMVEKRIPLRTPYVEKIVEHLKNFGGKELVAELVSMVRKWSAVRQPLAVVCRIIPAGMP
ncbi:PPR CONTAINING PLANT-LIKE PROTEIN [Salix koriyanagi]|uniref:PPR CONTAINING PLANT-LIKE PROTEIN n=1 Tax=Salix koriyanagi TaxID=2511006 RepID=A0A9Q0T4Y4_9ROSI|nr:PPR CONTAINING PLANT-LIKE PROTEIN [Salix koriyanagi]